jgi:hypothetical protein
MECQSVSAMILVRLSFRIARDSRGDWLNFHKLTSNYFRRSNGRAAGTARPKVQHCLARTELRQSSRVSVS